MVDNLAGEIWEKINRPTKYEYFVSNKGRIKAISGQSGSEVLIAVYGNKTPRVVNICYADGASKSTNLATLIAEAFIPGFDSTKHSVKRIDKHKPWTLDNMIKTISRVGRNSIASDTNKDSCSTAAEGKAIPGTDGLYKVFPNGKVISTPHNQEIPALESDYRHFVQLDIPNRGTQYFEVDKIVRELFGDAIAKQLPWSKQQKIESLKQGETQTDFANIDFKKAPLPKTSKGARPGRTCSVLISSPSIGNNIMDLDDAAKFLDVSVRKIKNKLYNWLRVEFRIGGEKVVATYPDMENKKPYIHRRGHKITCGTICNVDTGQSYPDFNTFANACKEFVNRGTLIHHLGRFGAITINNNTFKLEKLIDAESVPLSTKKRDKDTIPPSVIVEQINPSAKTNFTSILQKTFMELSQQAQTEQEFLTLSEMAKVMAQAVKQ